MLWWSWRWLTSSWNSFRRFLHLLRTALHTHIALTWSLACVLVLVGSLWIVLCCFLEAGTFAKFCAKSWNATRVNRFPAKSYLAATPVQKVVRFFVVERQRRAVEWCFEQFNFCGNGEFRVFWKFTGAHRRINELLKYDSTKHVQHYCKTKKKKSFQKKGTVKKKVVVSFIPALYKNKFNSFKCFCLFFFKKKKTVSHPNVSPSSILVCSQLDSSLCSFWIRVFFSNFCHAIDWLLLVSWIVLFRKHIRSVCSNHASFFFLIFFFLADSFVQNRH